MGILTAVTTTATTTNTSTTAVAANKYTAWSSVIFYVYPLVLIAVSYVMG